MAIVVNLQFVWSNNRLIREDIIVDKHQINASVFRTINVFVVRRHYREYSGVVQSHEYKYL